MGLRTATTASATFMDVSLPPPSTGCRTTWVAMMVMVAPKATGPSARTLSPTLMSRAEAGALPFRYFVSGASSTGVAWPPGADNVKPFAVTALITP
jgi:hypothetical protein